MSWKTINNGSKEGVIDWSRLNRISRSYQLNKLQSSHVDVASDRNWYDPRSWELRENSLVKVEWSTVGSQLMNNTTGVMSFCRSVAQPDVSSITGKLDSILEESVILRKKFRSKMSSARLRTTGLITSPVTSPVKDVEQTSSARNWSADDLKRGTTTLASGAVAAALASGAALKGAVGSKDTARVGAAVVEGAGTAAQAAVKFGSEHLPSSQDAANLLLKVVVQAGVSSIAGDTIGVIVANGLVNTAASSGDPE